VILAFRRYATSAATLYRKSVSRPCHPAFHGVAGASFCRLRLGNSPKIARPHRKTLRCGAGCRLSRVRSTILISRSVGSMTPQLALAQRANDASIFIFSPLRPAPSLPRV